MRTIKQGSVTMTDNLLSQTFVNKLLSYSETRRKSGRYAFVRSQRNDNLEATMLDLSQRGENSHE